MFSSHGSCRILKHAFVSFLIAATAFAAPRQAAAGQSQSPTAMTPAARDEADKGVDAFKNARYEEAVAHFQRAVELAPSSNQARLYLGTALSAEVVPGLDTPDNLKSAHQAIDVFNQVLQTDPHNVNAMKQVASLYYTIRELDEARTWQKKVLTEDPRDAEAAYAIGVIDWFQAYRNVQEALMPTGLRDDGQRNIHAPNQAMAAIKAENAHWSRRACNI